MTWVLGVAVVFGRDRAPRRLGLLLRFSRGRDVPVATLNGGLPFEVDTSRSTSGSDVAIENLVQIRQAEVQGIPHGIVWPAYHAPLAFPSKRHW